MTQWTGHKVTYSTTLKGKQFACVSLQTSNVVKGTMNCMLTTTPSSLPQSSHFKKVPQKHFRKMWNSWTNAVPSNCAWEQQGGFVTRRQKKESRKDEIRNRSDKIYCSYRKLRTHAWVFSQTLANGNNKNEIRQ